MSVSLKQKSLDYVNETRAPDLLLGHLQPLSLLAVITTYPLGACVPNKATTHHTIS
jgi:hypothetical protein